MTYGGSGALTMVYRPTGERMAYFHVIKETRPLRIPKIAMKVEGTFEVKVEGIKDLYPSERNQLIMIRHQLLENLAWRSGTEADLKRRFTEQAINRCGEIGLKVSVSWDYDVSDDPNDNHLYLVPTIIVEDRIDNNEEIDHDRMKDEVRSGEADGKEGVIDPDDPERKLKDPKKKNIV